MNYTIIGHTEDRSDYDRCGDYVSNPGEFEKFFFRDDREGFIKKWAEVSFEGRFEDLVILLNGAPDDEFTDEEFGEYLCLKAEMEEQKAILKIKADKAEAIRREEAAKAAEAKARWLAEVERQRDLQQLAALKKKLGQA